LLGFSVFFDIRAGQTPFPRSLSAFITGLYGLTIFYGLLYQRFGNTTAFAYVQLVGDIAAETVLVLITGGVETWFSFTYLLTILSASMILYGRAGFITATLASLSYGSILALQANAVVLTPLASSLNPEGFLNNAFVHMVAFYSMAFLGSRLADRLLRVTEDLARKDVDLSDLQAFSRDVIDYVPVGLVTTNEEGVITMANPAARRLCHTADDMTGHALNTFLPFLDFSASIDQRLEGHIRQEDGTVRTMELVLSPLKNRTGNIVGRIAIFQDLTGVRVMEREMQKRKQLAAVGELSASIAHELRNPLASLKGSMEMLREERGGTEGHRTQRLMDIAIREMDRLNGIISDFLLYARPKPPEKQRFALGGFLDDILIMFEHRKDIHILKEVGDEVVVFGDANQLKQVFLNLVANAVDAMPGGGILSLAASANQSSVCVDVRDSGKGIPEENLEKVFYPYFSTKNGGTGLGLAVSYRIIEEHAGHIRAFNSPGGGAVFSIILPREVIKDTTEFGSESAKTPSAAVRTPAGFLLPSGGEAGLMKNG